MKAWLASALAAGLLLGDAAPQRAAPLVQPAAPRSCTMAPSLSPAECEQILLKLARYADASYGSASTAAAPEDFHAAEMAEAPFRAGRFRNGSATALVMITQIDKEPVLVVGIGGSDDPRMWLADLRDIDLPYRQFRPLIRAIESYAASGRKVLLVGHSFGGAMVQLFMFAHSRDDMYRAITFGSPGALPKAGVFAARADPRILNVVVADDPYVFLGEHRVDVAVHARRNRIYALALANAIALESGLSIAEVTGSEHYLKANYLNNGSRMILSRRRPGPDVSTVLSADPKAHDIETYVGLLRPPSA